MNYTDIIIAPIVTEKATLINDDGRTYIFKVNKKANKFQIKKAIEDAFEVKVLKVNTVNVKPKRKRVGRFIGKTSAYKKAYITVREGDKIEL